MKDFQFFDALRADLRNYTLDHIAETLGEDALTALGRDEAVPAQLAAERVGGQLGLLVRLWWTGDTLSDDDVALAIPCTYRDADGCDGLAELLECTDDGVRARCQLVPVAAGEEELVWIASDRGSLQGARHNTDHVMGVGGATRTLAGLAHYKPGQQVLDLGTGCGIHAILAAKAGALAVATDISARALDYAQFNAALNEVEIETRLGSLFEPVAGSQFDVVVSNPPFVITPGEVRDNLGTLEYRDGGVPGDTLAADVVAGLGTCLAPDGSAYMLANWEIAGDVPDWSEHPRAWLASQHLDAVVIQREVIPADSYVEMWLHDGGLRAGHADYAKAYRAWLTDFQARAVSHVGFGYVLVQRDGEGRLPWQVFHDLRGGMPADVQGALELLWSAREITEETLSSLRLTNTNVEEHRRYHPGETDPWLISFAPKNGFADQIQADTALAGFVSVCDGELTVGQICDALAQLLEMPAPEVRSSLLPKVMHMVRLGMLQVVDKR
ncbi:DUF7059 domain-containing protein [Arcanobacterium phocae]|uniref:DUF7059 domain-containing protein n=1 Tax=Arcanobacterium phocae TaxID=131112 RepID=UPI001C0EA9E7|nr:methyltransferase [Arcanobacterium phocae]